MSKNLNLIAARAAGAALLALALCGPAAAQTTIADWTFSETAATALNTTANSGSGVDGAGGRWDVAISGLATDGAGLLSIRNAGLGGSGTRSAYADFGPYPGGTVSTGVLSLYTTFASWNFTAPGSHTPTFTLAFIEGNDFSTAEFSFGVSGSGLSLGAGVDPYGDGTALAGVASFGLLSSGPLTVRLDVNLERLSYGLFYDAGAGFQGLGNAAVDSLTAGVNSLRLSVTGDYTLGGRADTGLQIDRIWVTAAPVAAVPEPASAALLLGGLGLAAWLRRRAAR
jgi:hypothetical protein